MAPPPPPCPPFASWPQARPPALWHHPQPTPPTPPEDQPAQSSAGGRGVRNSYETRDGGKQESEVIEVEDSGEIEGSSSTTIQNK